MFVKTNIILPLLILACVVETTAQSHIQSCNFQDSLFRDYRNQAELVEHYWLQHKNNYLGKINIGDGTWTEVNPKVPRVDYLGIHFINPDTGWAVGAEGAIIYSVNGGKNWFVSNSSTSNHLLNVHSFNGQVVVASGYNGTIVRSTDGGLTWQLINSGVIGNLWEIKMINDTLGWVCGTGPSLLRTTNAGESWNIVNTGYYGFNYWALDYLDENILYVAGSGGNILKTIDGGNSWQLVQTGYVESLYRIVVFDTLRIVTGGQNAKTFYTLDGGVTWNYTLTTSEIDAMAFANDSVGYLAGANSNSFIYKTTNGGISWNPQTAFPGGYWLMFVNDSVGFNAGLDLVIKKTTDQGNNWNQLILNDNLIDVWFESENLGWVLSLNNITITTDGGGTWSSVNIPGYLTITGLSTIYFLDSLTGFVGAGANRIFKTIDGGYTWQRKNVYGTQDTSIRITDFFFVNNGLGWASAGELIRTTDLGENWFAIQNSPGGIAIQFLDSLLGFTLTAYLNKTMDGGYNWQHFTLPDMYISDIYFDTPQIGWYLSTDKLFHTMNSGTNWTQILYDPDLFQSKFNWLNERKGFITGLKTYYTADSGYTWIDLTTEVGAYVKRMHSGNDYSGYAVGDLGLIIKYIDTTIVPVELSSFSFELNNNNVSLKWTTETELNNYGFAIERKRNQGVYENIGFVEGNGTSTIRHTYVFQDKNLQVGNYVYRLRQIDFNGSESFSEELNVSVVNIMEGFELYSNYPNPFNPSTNIEFFSNHNQKLQLKVFNELGEEVAVLFNDSVEPGKKYSLIFDGSNLSSGVYYYSLIQGDKRKNKKMVLLK